MGGDEPAVFGRESGVFAFTSGGVASADFFEGGVVDEVVAVVAVEEAGIGLDGCVYCVSRYSARGREGWCKAHKIGGPFGAAPGYCLCSDIADIGMSLVLWSLSHCWSYGSLRRYCLLSELTERCEHSCRWLADERLGGGS